MACKDLREGVIGGLRKSVAERLRESARLGIIEPWENAMAEKPARTQERRINFGYGTIDRADDLKP